MTFGLSEHLKTPLQRRLYRLVGPTVESVLGLKGTEGFYNESARRYREHSQHPGVFAWFDSVAQAVGTQEEVDLPAEFEFPRQGPLVIIANHPFGVIDPVMLARWAARFRPDLKVMTNSMLPDMMPELKDLVIPVDPFGGEGAAKRNLGPMKEAIRLLRKGGALLIFPAGEVAAYKPGRGLEEPKWTNHLGSLVRRTQATVLPVYFPGSNSTLFHAAGLIHPRLRTGLLLREFCKREGTTVSMRVGNSIPYSRLKKFEDDESLTRYLRIHTFVLHQRGKEQAKLTVEGQNITTTPPTECQHERMVEEIDRLRARGGRLVGQGNLSVYQAHSHEIPVLLPEIGRLREVTFRAVGEGTGNDIDLDKYDRYYEHLILWDEEKEQVAGAYRLGRADVILREYGPKGLYTNTLFHFEKPFLANLEAAVEMGRSFVVKEYQRTLASLPLLWKGIACWVARNPHYKKLFGPVSISKDYSSTSRKMIVEFLQDNRMHPHLSAFVKARNPFRYMRTRRMMREFISAELQNVDDCSALISSLETDGKGIPVLLKHYLKLNATILSFNVDKDFSSVVDGLILVDFTEIDPRLLSKYMGEESCREYRARHGLAPAA